MEEVLGGAPTADTDVDVDVLEEVSSGGKALRSRVYLCLARIAWHGTRLSCYSRNQPVYPAELSACSRVEPAWSVISEDR